MKAKIINKDYIIPVLGGRLGNILFMIANAYSKALEYNKQFLVYEESLNPKHFNGVDYKKNILSKINYINFFDENGIFNPKKPSDEKHTIYSGYFQSEKYFKKHSEFIKNLFSPDFFFLEKVKQKIPQLFSESFVSINVRRGDYLSLPDYHPTISVEYINKSIKLISNKYYLISSDDIDWCKKNINIKNAIFLDGEWEPHETIWINSLCEDFIISNSSFSWWGAYLSRNKEKKVVCPETWFGPKGIQYWQDIYWDDCLILPTYFEGGEIKIK